jgi:hypothetical protein
MDRRTYIRRIHTDGHTNRQTDIHKGVYIKRDRQMEIQTELIKNRIKYPDSGLAGSVPPKHIVVVAEVSLEVFLVRFDARIPISAQRLRLPGRGTLHERIRRSRTETGKTG